MMVVSPMVDERFVIERGTWADYKALSAFHYKADDPGVVSKVYRYRFRSPSVVGRYLARHDTGQVVGVQMVSMPHAGCTMRDYATGGRYRGVDLTTGTIMLNREVESSAQTSWSTARRRHRRRRRVSGVRPLSSVDSYRPVHRLSRGRSRGRRRRDPPPTTFRCRRSRSSSRSQRVSR